MSYSVYLVAVKETEVYERNVTYNNSPMINKAIGCTMRDLNGRKGSEILLVLNRAIADMARKREEYETLNPPNGWGGYEDVLDFLRGLRVSCEDYPEGILRVT